MIDYENVWTSVTAYINEQKKMIVANGICTADEIEMIDWEDHANTEELPAKHVIGPASLAIEEDSAYIYRVSFTVGLASFNDHGLFKHRKMIALMAKALGTGMRTVVYNATTEEPYSWLKLVDGMTIAPLSKSNNRAFQVIQAEALVDPTA